MMYEMPVQLLNIVFTESSIKSQLMDVLKPNRAMVFFS